MPSLALVSQPPIIHNLTERTEVLNPLLELHSNPCDDIDWDPGLQEHNSASVDFPNTSYYEGLQASNNNSSTEGLQAPNNDSRKLSERSKTSWGWKYVTCLRDKNYKCTINNCEADWFIGREKGMVTISNVTSHIKKAHKDVWEDHEPKAVSGSPTQSNLNYKLIEWVARNNHSFSIVEEPELLSLLKFKPLKRCSLVNVTLPKIYQDYKLKVFSIRFIGNHY